jgi:hypothetical protein
MFKKIIITYPDDSCLKNPLFTYPEFRYFLLPVSESKIQMPSVMQLLNVVHICLSTANLAINFGAYCTLGERYKTDGWQLLVRRDASSITAF